MLAETKRLHPYELPALLVLPTEGGSAEYCGWIASQTARPEPQMSGEAFVLAIDQGTTSTRAILFDRDGRARATAQVPLTQIYPAPGQVEHDPEEIWRAVLQVGNAVLGEAGPRSVAAIGITNQRETTVVWERATGKPLANAIVWQDRRTAELCAELAHEGWGAHVAEATGLVIDPYFSATKLAWLLRNVPDLDVRAEAGEVCFGTIDSFLLFRLTGGRLHATDATNAARTKLYDIRSGQWDERLLDRLGVPRAMLPEVRDSQGDFGETELEHFGASIPIRGVAGDQQAAAYGQACFRPGMLKATYGTGCFVLANTGAEKVASATRMLSTIFHQLEGRRTYALEGAIFMAGATVQWLQRQSRPHRHGGGERGLGAAGRPQGAGLSGSGLSGTGRAVLGCQRQGRHSRADPRRVEGRSRGGGARGRRLPDPRSPHRHAAGHGGERHPGAVSLAGRWRHDGECLADAAARRHFGPEDRSGAEPRDDGARRRLSRRATGGFFRRYG